ncbi:hypothetical protein [Kibdelosporangium aridum]|uniref:Uncharacterized protein n=1 Tax=Kibdelosporangium aridum TaxID=2030 RepID=A0A1Y5Y8X7_KIBAR|nr:hypothetical protein [Kibdelosporangium aridum]SMD26261.1 hypothetical protein SAMN05661093_09842 [Kibdelosporangium aridum]
MSRAALIYQHATDERDRQIAAALDTLVETARQEAADKLGENLGHAVWQWPERSTPAVILVALSDK